MLGIIYLILAEILGYKLIVIFCIDNDLVHDFETSLFTHGLNLADDLADKALLWVRS